MKKQKIYFEQIAIAAILLLATFLRLYKLNQEGFANLYYAATVKSMLISFKNFFYVAFDPGAFITVDKPPVGLWIEGLSASIFGFKGWVLILPQAIAGVLTVWLIYYIVKKQFSLSAGFLASFFLAITPIFVATNRNNTIDSTLIFCLLIAVWYLLRAIEKSSLPLLLLSMVVVGIGFNIKMLQAYMILPALYLSYLFFSKVVVWRKIYHLFIATIVLIAVSLSWAVIVDATPKDMRPIISNSTNNSVLNLIIGHNAMARFSSKKQAPQGSNSQQSSQGATSLTRRPPRSNKATNDGFARNSLPKESGEAGLFRLLNTQLSGQISWFFPIILFGLFLWFRNFRFSTDLNQQQRAQISLWLGWLIPSMLYFSFTQGLFHRHYLSMLAPPIAALAAIALIALRDASLSSKKWTGWLLAIVFLFNGILQIQIMLKYNDWLQWILPMVIVLNATMIVAIVAKQLRKNSFKTIKYIFSGIGLVAISFVPIVWALTPIMYGGDANLPHAGPELLDVSRLEGGFTPNSLKSKDTEKLIEFLNDNRQAEKFLVAVPSAIMYGSKLVIQTGEPIITLGGFNGRDETITIAQIEKMLAKGEVRFFLIEKPPISRANIESRRLPSSRPSGNKAPNKNLLDIYQWIAQNSEVISVEKWQGNSKTMLQMELFEAKAIVRSK